MKRKHIGLSAVVGLALCALTIAAVVNWGSCQWYAYQTERQTRFAPYIGYMVKTPGGWVPRNELRTTQ